MKQGHQSKTLEFKDDEVIESFVMFLNDYWCSTLQINTNSNQYVLGNARVKSALFVPVSGQHIVGISLIDEYMRPCQFMFKDSNLERGKATLKGVKSINKLEEKHGYKPDKGGNVKLEGTPIDIKHFE